MLTRNVFQRFFLGRIFLKIVLRFFLMILWKTFLNSFSKMINKSLDSLILIFILTINTLKVLNTGFLLYLIYGLLVNNRHNIRLGNIIYRLHHLFFLLISEWGHGRRVSDVWGLFLNDLELGLAFGSSGLLYFYLLLLPSGYIVSWRDGFHHL